MSVLMRGVQMPKNCEECNFKGECRNYWEKIREAYIRPSWCPLVEIAEQTEPMIEQTIGNKATLNIKNGVVKVEPVYRQTEPNSSENPNNCEPQTFDKPTKCLGCLYSDLDKAFHPCASCVDFGKYVGEVSGKTEPQTERRE